MSAPSSGPTANTLNDVILGTAPLADQSAAGTAKVDGDEQALHEFIALLDNVELWFDIVTP